MKTVHVLYRTRAPCNVVQGRPGQWPEGHAWMDLSIWPEKKDHHRRSQLAELQGAKLCTECDDEVERSRAPRT